MFCKTTYCVLILMMEAALVYESGEGVEADFIVHKHTIPRDEFDLAIKRLDKTKLLTMVNNRLYLQMPPNKITVWQILTEVSGDNIFTGRYADQQEPVTPTSVMTMIYKEREAVLRMIENRLNRQKLSTWSERASKTIYI